VRFRASDESRENYGRARAVHGRLVEAVHGPPADDWRAEGVAADYEPRPYQLRAALAAHGAERLLLADSVGLGKTLSAYLLRERVRADSPGVRTLVVCPAGLKLQWRSEFFWYSDGRVQPLVAEGGPAKRERRYAEFRRRPGAVLCANYELLLRDAGLASVFAAADIVVADEASRFKTCGTKTAKRLKALSDDGGVRWRLALTATPIEVGCKDLYSIVEWLDPALFGPRMLFDKLYVERIEIRPRRGGRFWKIVGYKNTDHLARRVRPRMLRRTPEDVGEQMPDVVAVVEWLDLPGPQREAYEAARSGALRQISDGARPMVAALDAVRACLSPSLVAGRSGKGVKTGRIVDVLATEAAGERALVFTHSRQYIERELLPALADAGIRASAITGGASQRARDADQAAFCGGDLRVLVVDSAGTHGLNLPCGLVLNADFPWTQAQLEQRVGRARRMGTGVERVRVLNLLARDTVEERVLARLLGRRRLSEVVVGRSAMNAIDRRLTADDWRAIL
jgi:SNF2 family DNA or RNA helicase